MIHLYGFTSPTGRLPAIEGVDHRPIEAEDADAIRAVVSRHSTRVEPNRDAVVRHGLVVEALRESADAVLPARFGEEFATDESLREAIASRAAEQNAQHERVEGCVELAVRLLDAKPSSVVAAAGGSAYMRLRLREEARREALLSALHGRLQPHARCSTTRSRAGEHTAAYLVATSDQGEFQRALDDFADAHPEVTIVCTGPWAPYSFTSTDGYA
jgi:hypothetical protein